MRLALVLPVCALLLPAAVQAMPGGSSSAPEMTATAEGPAALKAVDVKEQLNARVPLDAVLRDEQGRQVTLGQVLSPERPTVLSLVYYDCPTLCSLLLNGLTKSLRDVSLTPGKDYQLVSVSIDPRDTPEKSLQRRRRNLQALGQPETAPWSFLTGEDAQVRRVADAVGFGYAYDPASGQYAHPAVVMVLTPDGRVSRYLYGAEFASRDMHLALLEASEGRVGTTFERVILSCFQYDPATKRYGFFIWGFLRILGVVTLGGLAALVVITWRRDRRRPAGGA
jgi:protein SCO1